MANRERLTAKTQSDLRESLAKKQKYKCYLCETNLKKLKKQQWHLDHDHDEGHCRTLLCSVCNGMEGKFKSRAGIVTNWSGTGLTPSEYLRKLADYWEEDFTDNPIHESHARDQVKKFKRLSAKEQVAMLEPFVEEPGKNIPERAKQARKLLKEGKIWI